MAESDAADKAVAAAPAPASVSEPLVGERCRCCMAPGPAAKDLSSQYDFMGEKEVYADMLLESFDIRLEKIQSAGWTICEVCIGRLRDSSNFKKQVLYSERCLLQSVGQLPSSGDQKISGDSKMKMVKCESMSDDNDASFLDDDYFDLETDIKEVSVKFEPQPSTSELSNDEDIPLSKMTSTKKKVTTRSSMPMLTISPLKRSSVQKTPAKKTITLKSGVKITSTSGKLTPGKLNLQSSASMKKGMGAVSKMLATASKLGQSPGTKMVLKPGQTKLTLGSTTLKRATVPKAGTKVMVKPGAKLAAAAEKGSMGTVTTHVLKTSTGKKPQQTIQTCIRMRRYQLPIKAVPAHTGIHFAKAILMHSTAMPFEVRNGAIICPCQSLNLRETKVESVFQHLRDHFTNPKNESVCLYQAPRRLPKTILRVDITNLSCKICNESITDLEHFENHITTQHDKKIYKDECDVLVPYKLDTNQCQMCGIQFHSIVLLDDHMETHFPIVVCEQCGHGFMNHKKLSQHKQDEHEGRKFICEECGKSYTGRDILQQHVKRVHKNIPLYKCAICSTRFTSYWVKKLHMNKAHGWDYKEPQCEVCKKTFTTDLNMRLHMAKEHGIGAKFKCPDCGKVFINRTHLELHVRRDHEQIRLDCRFCDSSHIDVRQLGKHMKKQHPELKKSLCRFCGYPCEDRRSLSLHLETAHKSSSSSGSRKTLRTTTTTPNNINTFNQDVTSK